MAIVRKWGDRVLKALQTPLECGLAHSEIFHHPISGLKPFKCISVRNTALYAIIVQNGPINSDESVFALFIGKDRGILFNRKIIINQRGQPTAGVPLDIHEFAEWLLWSVNAYIDALKAGTYNQFIETHLPVQHRIGTILRKDWWSIFPENRREFFSGHSQEDADLFTNYMEEADRQDIVAPPPKEMSANDYFRVCAGSSSPGCPRR